VLAAPQPVAFRNLQFGHSLLGLGDAAADIPAGKIDKDKEVSIPSRF
jgi:hypothetical protein